MKTITNHANDAYQKIGYDDLVTYAVLNILSSGREATFENIVAEVFTLFPERFALRGHPQWPDSAVVNKSWWRCRTDKKLIVGSVKDGFQLTQRGLEVAEKVASQLQRDTAQLTHPKIKSELRTRAGRLLRSLEQSPGFLEFQKNRNIDKVGHDDLADMLLLLPDSPLAKLKSNLAQFKDAARLYARDDILEFLGLLEKRFLTRSQL